MEFLRAKLAELLVAAFFSPVAIFSAFTEGEFRLLHIPHYLGAHLVVLLFFPMAFLAPSWDTMRFFTLNRDNILREIESAIRASNRRLP